MKKLVRSFEDRKLCGVCGGIGEYLNIDPTLVRLGFVAGTLLSAGTGVILYIAAAVIIPEEEI